MPFSHNLKLGIDLPIWQWLRFQPVTTAAGACLINDKRGTDRYIYFLFSVTSFWRYDIITDSWLQLASPGALGGSGTWGAGTCMVFDPSQGTAGRIWLLNGYTTQCGFGYYDIATDTWTSRSITNLPAIWGTDGSMAHTCSVYNASGNDDYIYLIGNNATVFYRYSISGNSWSTMANALLAAAGAGCALCWIFGTDTDKLIAIRGAATSTIYRYSIGTPGWTTLTYKPTFETFTTGTSIAYDPTNGRIWIQKDATHRLYYYDLATNLMMNAGVIPYTSGTAMAGDGLCYVKTADGAQFIYYRRQSATEFFRSLIFF